LKSVIARRENYDIHNLPTQNQRSSKIAPETDTRARVISYRKELFDKILELDGLNTYDVCESLNIQDNIDAIFESGERSGNSGSFFFFSKDKQFVVKTMRFDEKNVLLGMLDRLYEHFVES
jgi:hypothetical protein